MNFKDFSRAYLKQKKRAQINKKTLSRIDVIRLNILNSGVVKFLALSESMPSPLRMKNLQFGSSKIILHCGAHLGEESTEYKRCGAEEIFWVEAQPEKIVALKESFGSRNVFSGVLADESRVQVPFYVTSNSLSSSSRRINPNQWQVVVDEVIQLQTITLDDVAREIYLINRTLPDLLVLDLQGSEYEAILGGIFLLSKIDFIIVEFSTFELYDNQKTLNDIVSILNSKSFEMFYKVENSGHGEAFFVRTTVLTVGSKIRRSVFQYYFILRAKASKFMRRAILKGVLVLERLN